jgi:hypothetical protein
MLELVAFVRLHELSYREDKQFGRLDADVLYREFGLDPPALIVAIGMALSFLVRLLSPRHARKVAQYQPEMNPRRAIQNKALTRLESPT